VVHISDIKLIRTNITFCLSQKGDKDMSKGAYPFFIDCLVVHPSLASEVVLCESVTQHVAFYRVRLRDF
jgi:hypothetical protein